MDDPRLFPTTTPLEQMVLMLNDKMDALHARVDEVYRQNDSAQNKIPWAEIGTHRTDPFPWAEIGTQLTDPRPPSYIDEWTRRGWDVWRVTMPSEPDAPPSYEITNRRRRADLPTTAHNNAKYDRILRSGEIHNGIVWNSPIERELLTSNDA